MKEFKDSIELLEKLDSAINDISSNISGKKLSELGTINVILLDLIKRIHTNLYAIKLILPEFIEFGVLSVPIGLLIRTCLSDALTGFYLLTFSNDEQSFQNELNVMALDYISYLDNLTHIEPLFNDPDISNKKLEELIIEKLDEIAEKYPDLTEKREDLKIKKKSPSKIRSTSDIKMFKDDKKLNQPITDLSKFERLIDHPDKGINTISYLYPLFRFYSQFHHYSILSRKLIDEDIKVHFRHLTLSFWLLHQTLYSLCTAVEISEKSLIPIQQNIEELYQYAVKN